ncbi:diacylglycerol/lipid kinase family protein [Phycisphaera mikurensis]|uniref:diacylglycerol/lipid kinase family protein n=1 Tax=Phycisphaera mikurensis TaxID=547188 RepID=UPI0014616770|nr:diacylglycerol kinase family protein [Phycisphaera mikurensis]MBB6442208.1 diacylglycerol kinase family enzyme [Phycisphaera mikurensis]
MRDDALDAAVRGCAEVRRHAVGDDPEAELREEAAWADLLVTFGGDGSLHLAANAVLETGADCEIGLVPNGTGNDFARHLGTDDAAPEDALARVLGWPARSIDVLRVPRPAGEPRRAVNAISFGAIAGTSASTPDAVKALAGGAAYTAWGAARAAVVGATPVRVTGRGPDGSRFAWRGDALGVVASNGRFTGGGFRVAPAARLASGRFEVLILPDLRLTQRVALSRRLRRPGGDAPDADPRAWPPRPLVAASLTELRVESEAPLPLNADGESSEADRLEVTAEPGALRMRVPAGA